MYPLARGLAYFRPKVDLSCIFLMQILTDYELSKSGCLAKSPGRAQLQPASGNNKKTDIKFEMYFHLIGGKNVTNEIATLRKALFPPH